MKTVSATDAKQRLAALLDAAQREPVLIRRQKRDVAVILSVEEYDRIRGVNNDEFERFCDRVAEKAKAHGLKDIVMTRNAHWVIGKPFPRDRYVVFRIYGPNPSRQYCEEFWSLDSEELAKDLCRFLVTDKLGAYVLDRATEKKIFQLNQRK